MKKFSILLLFFNVFFFQAQKATVEGYVRQSVTNEPVAYANVFIQGTTLGVTTDEEGYYKIENAEPGVYNLEASFLGFESLVQYEITLSTVKVVEVNFYLEETTTEVEEVTVKASGFTKTKESPVSVRSIGVTEIQRSPGGNRDISVVIQNLPGVASPPSFRNDIIIRGGAPNENRFYLDEVEVPNINHFATQGSSGGPVGMINVNFIRNVDYYAGAFPANRGNTLSSYFQFNQKEGNSKKIAGNFLVGSSDAGITLDGPIGKKANFVFSLRRSYLQFLFQALKLPFLPTYTDYQYKFTLKLDKKNEVSFIGLGALDEFQINESVNDGVTDTATLNRNTYFLENIPVNNQFNYTFGVVYKHYSDNGFQTVVLSRNYLKNTAKKYFQNVEVPENLLQDYSSSEAENKLRLENTYLWKGAKINMGLNYELARYTNSTYFKTVIAGSPDEINFSSKLYLNKYGLFLQGSRNFFSDFLTLSAGIRTDFNSFSSSMSNPLDQLSPRVSAALNFSKEWSFNANVGRYYQLPTYTTLGYRNADGSLVNKNNTLRYIRCDHLVGGLEYRPGSVTRITAEGFYKLYDDYPLALTDSISLANLGADFGIIGSEPVSSLSEGRAYGLEVLIQQKIWKGFYGILAYTWVRSEFTNGDDNYVPSSWDYGNIINLTAGYRFKGNWEVGFKFRYTGGGPYTPYNIASSSLIQNWQIRNQGILDYSRINTKRLPAVHQLDVRIDKQFYFKKWMLDLYLDIQNCYGSEVVSPPLLLLDRAGGEPIIDSNDPTRYQVKEVENVSNNILPSIGIMVEF